MRPALNRALAHTRTFAYGQLVDVFGVWRVEDLSAFGLPPCM